MMRVPPPPRSEWAWFFDVDGTLALLATTPDAVVVDTRMRRLIEALHHEAGGALALVSGRSIEGVDALFHGVTLAVSGQHGAERRNSAGVIKVHTTRSDGLSYMRVHFAQLEQAYEGLLLEDKGLSLAMHYRRAPTLGSLVLQRAQELFDRYGEGFHLQLGKYVVEIVAAGHNKGTAVDEFMAEPPFRGRVPVFLGDDFTDEHAFLTVNELNGFSIKVGSGSSNARYRLSNVNAVQAWMEALPWTHAAMAEPGRVDDQP